MSLELAIVMAGVGQLFLAAASLAIPGTLGWREETARLKPLTREVFWTYAAYIWSFNVCFGVLSAFFPGLLLERTPLARAVAGFIAAYWTARLLIQFITFGKHAPPGPRFKVAEGAMVLLFLYLSITYAGTAL